MSEDNKNIDLELLGRYRTQTVVSGLYLDAWNKLMGAKDKLPPLDDYLITFDENSEEIIIYFTKPLKEKVPGGGGGSVKINKKTGEVGQLKLSR
jgi:hypothetical protein